MLGPSSGSKSSVSTQEACSSELVSRILNENLRPVVGKSGCADVNVEENWKTLAGGADNPDVCLRNCYLRARIMMGINALRDVMPLYHRKDFLVVNRKNDKGVWRAELWTASDFDPTEILYVLIPFCSCEHFPIPFCSRLMLPHPCPFSLMSLVSKPLRCLGSLFLFCRSLDYSL